jgi:hypothetical protein
MPQPRPSPSISPADSDRRHAALRDLQAYQPFHKVVRKHGLETYQLYLWTQEEGIHTDFGPPDRRAQMILQMVDEFGVKMAAQQLRLPDYEVRDLTKRLKWWKQPPNWAPGTKVALGDTRYMVITVYNGLCGKVMDEDGKVIDPFPWKHGRQRVRSLGTIGFTERGKQLEPYEDQRGKRPRFHVVASAMRDLGCGMKVKDVAEIYGRSEATISTWAKEHDVKVDWLRRYHGPIPSDWDRAIMRVAGELGPTETGDRFGLSRQRVHQVLHRYGEAGWREAPGWEPGEEVRWGGIELKIAAVYDADVGAVWDSEGTFYHVFHWNWDGSRCQSEWIAERTIQRRFKWKEGHGKR